MGSRGSVIPFFIDKRDQGAKEIPVTDKRMTRFNISLQAGVDLVMFALSHHIGGELFVPKIPSYHLVDVAEAIAPNIPVVEVGIRPGEKLHEEMITVTDAMRKESAIAQTTELLSDKSLFMQQPQKNLFPTNIQENLLQIFRAL